MSTTRSEQIPEFSVVVPVRDLSDSLARCLKGLEQQHNREQIEVIVVDDGSIDDSLEVARRFGVRVVTQTRQGAAVARNRGVIEARGHIVLFLDADCIPSSDWGHLEQYTEAKTTQVPFARDGMYYKEFPVMFDWLHNGEGLTVFNLQGLSDPGNANFQTRVRRFAGFYMSEDPQALNYDPKHKIIRSMFNGSRGPLLRKATGLDWAGDPIEVKGRFKLGHGEESYEQMVAHFKDYNDIVGDHPQNLLATSLALNAFMLTGETKYRNWLLEYVDAWRERMIENGYIIPSNIGLDGTIGGETEGKWYGGVYGWGFTVVVPQDGTLANRITVHQGFTGFMNAYLLTGDDKYLEPWRRQIDAINAQGKMVKGKKMYPRMYGRRRLVRVPS